MRTRRQTDLRRALLLALSYVPASHLLREDTLCADAARMVSVRPTQAELGAEISAADAENLITGILGEDCRKWKLSDAGRAWLAENP